MTDEPTNYLTEPPPPVSSKGVNSQEAVSPTTVQVTVPDREFSPDVDAVQSVVLKQGPRSSKIAKYAVLKSRHTGEFHHAALSIQTYRKKQGVSTYDREHSVSLSGEGEDEIQKLMDFLQMVRGGSVPKETSTFLVIPAPQEAADREAAETLLKTLSDDGKAHVMAEILRHSTQENGFLETLIERATKEPQLFAEAAAALNLATYKAAVEELQNLISSSQRVPESRFQQLLAANPWMFGSEYSELLGRRRWTRDEQQDFVVRRTADGYIELIEIKTPLQGAALFNYDASHRSLYAGVELSKVVGQVENYIERLDADRNSILANDHEDTCKIRGKIIVGRDGDVEHQRALRRFNAHHHRIEVITFDQLVKIAQRVISYLESTLHPLPSDAPEEE